MKISTILDPLRIDVSDLMQKGTDARTWRTHAAHGDASVSVRMIFLALAMVSTEDGSCDCSECTHVVPSEVAGGGRRATSPWGRRRFWVTHL